MSEAARSNRTIYVGGLPPHIAEDGLVAAFAPFGDIVDVQMPREGMRKDQDQAQQQQQQGGGHRGFGFLVFSDSNEAQDAIDNMHLNELGGRILNVNLAKPLKTASSGGNRPVWDDEEWIKKYAKPIGEASHLDEQQDEEEAGDE